METQIQTLAKLNRSRTLNTQLINALKRLLNAFDADARLAPNMPVCISVETNSAAIQEAVEAIRKAEATK